MVETLSYIESSLHPLAMPLNQIKVDPDNARRHPESNIEIIRRSLEHFGQQKPIVIDANKTCVAGSGTLLAAQQLNWSHIAAVQSHLSGQQATAYAIADNRATDTSLWHDKKLAEQLAHLQNDQEIDHLLTGFNDQEIEQWIDQSLSLDKADADKLREIQITDAYHILVQCDNESTQRELFERLQQEGHSCRVLTL